MSADDVIQRFKPRPRRRGWSARCPAHDDQRNSLSLAIGHDGRVLVHCFAGCPPAAVVREAGLELRDLFGDTPPRRDYERKSYWPSPLDDARRQTINAARRQLKGARDAYPWADEVRGCYAVVREARAVATRLGPESELGWDLLARAAWLETATRLAEANRD
jgi:hypothetical protein